MEFVSDTAPTIVGMLHVPINTMLASPVEWRRTLGLPGVCSRDWVTIQRLHASVLPNIDGATGFLPQRSGAERAEELVRSLSFYPVVEDRILAEARVLQSAGLDGLLLENVAGPYFVRGQQPPTIFWVMRLLAEQIRAECPSISLGIQVLAEGIISGRGS